MGYVSTHNYVICKFIHFTLLLWPAMRKGIIHGSMKQDQPLSTMSNLLSTNVVVSILVSAYWHQNTADTTTYRIYIVVLYAY